VPLFGRRLRVRPLALLASTVFATALFSIQSPTEPVRAEQPGEVRALWVDSFHDGIKTQAQVDRLLADARRANVNTLLVQVRRRGDLFYLGGPEPVASDMAAGFDALKAVLAAAHNGSPRLEVQAWLSVYPIWSSQTPPASPNHPLNRFGPSVLGTDHWLMQRDDGETWTGEGYWLDPGNPGVTPYLIDLISDLTRRYELDGVHLDRLRYYKDDGLQRRWGYNPRSVLGFDLENGRFNQPDQDDPLWAQYRRDRVTDFLRQLRPALLAIRPKLAISAAVVPWGDGPRTDLDWQRSAAYGYVFQDWRAWLEEGLLDQAFAMNYMRESTTDQVAWLDRWLAWERGHGYGRQVIAGLGVYLNSPADSIHQVRRALATAPDGTRLAGVALYSYATPDASRANADPADDSPEGYVWDLLTRPLADNEFNPPFAAAVAAPPRP
jgi:uncharacterized lipoprotein YddW (UPF0748 family)